MLRFEPEALDAETTVAYFRNRAFQLLHDDDDWAWSGVVTPLVTDQIEWGTETSFQNSHGQTFVSIYVYASSRGQGHLSRHARARAPGLHYLTLPGCGIHEALAHLDPSPHMAAPISDWTEYRAVERHYSDACAQRSGLFLMQHIDEGLRILHRWLRATDRAKRAWCLHPLVQGDADLVQTYGRDLLDAVEPATLILALEYRNIANAFLARLESHPGYNDPSQIALSPLAEVNALLIADKLQNCKDFRRHHRATHPHAERLDCYFRAWLTALCVPYTDVERLDRETRIPVGNVGPPRVI